MRAPSTWAKTARMKFFEDLLFWFGEAKRRDLAERFSVADSVATEDIGNYEALCFERGVTNFMYDRKKKRFLRALGMKRILSREDDKSILEEKAADPTNSFIDAVRMPTRQSDKEVLQGTLRAILDVAPITFSYVSEDGLERRRSAIPTRLVKFSGRWHFRGWCLDKLDWRDFLIGRIYGIELKKHGDQATPSVDVPYDHEWHELVRIFLAINPDLPENRRKRIAYDYSASEHGEIIVEARKCFQLYYESAFKLSENPEESPVIFLRGEEINPIF